MSRGMNWQKAASEARVRSFGPKVKPATPAQLAYLKALGYRSEYGAVAMNATEASGLIKQLQAERAKR